jgi:hypothetical protein
MASIDDRLNELLKLTADETIEVGARSTFTLPIADYRAPKTLAELARAIQSGRYTKPNIKFYRAMTEAEMTYVFATDKWIPTKLTASQMSTMLPHGIMKSRTSTVSNWQRILRALDREPSYVTAQGDAAYFIIKGLTTYLVTLDIKNKIYSTNCPEYDGKDDNAKRRFGLCKHIISALGYYRNDIYNLAGLSGSDWEESYNKCATYASSYASSTEALGTWYYYYLKNVVAHAGLSYGFYTDPKEVESLITKIESEGSP